MKHKVNEITIGYKEKRQLLKEAYKIKSSRDTADFLFENWEKETIGLHECFKILFLNNAHKVKGIYTLSKGGITGTLVDIRILIAIVLKSLSVSIILVHNHPSGILKPSYSDKQLTEKIKTACSYFDIKLLDHIILSPTGEYFSFADNLLI